MYMCVRGWVRGCDGIVGETRRHLHVYVWMRMSKKKVLER